MKAKVLLLILFSGVILCCCRSKNKIITVTKENIHQTEKVKTDSLSVHTIDSAVSTSADTSLNQKEKEISGDLLITGKSDILNPFVFHNVIENDTVQSISIVGNADYSIRSYHTKALSAKTENKKEESTNIVKEVAQNTVSKEKNIEKASTVSQETKKIKVKGFEITAWIFFTILGIILILVFFIYKYFKK